ncbi:C13 family peptidase [Eionea flava]
MVKYAFVMTCGLIVGALAIEYKDRYTKAIPVPVATLADGAVYEGELRKGLLSGAGRLVWPNQEYYEGEFEEGLFHGEGVLHARDFFYEGMFSRGDMQGNGKLRYSNDDVYEGQMDSGLPNGLGVFTSGENTYTGEFVDGLYHGEGVLVSASGYQYEGGFEKDLFHGDGVYTRSYESAEGELLEEVYAGTFVNDDFTGEGRWEKEDAFYEGEFVNYAFDGKGIYQEKDRRYEGEFTAGYYHGVGVYQHNDGEEYTGSFLNGRYSGKGVLIAENGDKYEGEFLRGRKHGKGILTYAEPLDGIAMVKGEWDRGQLVSADDPRLAVSPSVMAEHALYHQSALLQSSLAAIEQENPELIDLYFVGIGGDGSQGVFRREVSSVKQWFDQYYHTAHRSIALINNRLEYDQHPLATQTSIQQTLDAVAEKMDNENDVLFVYLSSHGSSDFRFYLYQPGLSLDSLPAEQLGEILSALPVRHKVVVISACYSGGFIKEIKDDYMMVITAASADKTSFGCSDRSTMTYFGEAFFKDALFNQDAPSATFIDAFERARDIVKGREAAQGLENSNPLIYKPKAIVAHLEKWRAQKTDNNDRSVRSAASESAAP